MQCEGATPEARSVPPSANRETPSGGLSRCFARRTTISGAADIYGLQLACTRFGGKEAVDKRPTGSADNESRIPWIEKDRIPVEAAVTVTPGCLLSAST